jgi:hypothetical protein
MRKIFFYIILFNLLCFSKGFSSVPFDTNYIHIFKQNYTVVADIYGKQVNFSLNPFMKVDSIDSRQIKYIPNVSSYFGLSASYKGWGIGVSFPVPTSVKSDSIYGKTTFYDYKFSLNKRKFGGTAYLKYYKGFYLNNPALFDTTWKGGVVPHRNDMQFATLGINAYYIFNNQQFSMKSVLSQTERQKQTAATFLLMTDIFASVIESDSSLIPISDQAYYQDLKGFQDMFLYSFAVMGGYAHCNVISDNYYVCPMVYIGPGFQHKLMNADVGVIKKDNLFLKTDFKFAAGYNAENAYLGVLFDVESNLMPAKYANFKSTVFSVDFFVGCRFW